MSDTRAAERPSRPRAHPLNLISVHWATEQPLPVSGRTSSSGLDREGLDARSRLRDELERGGGERCRLGPAPLARTGAPYLLVAADDVAPFHQRDARVRGELGDPRSDDVAVLVRTAGG